MSHTQIIAFIIFIDCFHSCFVGSQHCCLCRYALFVLCYSFAKSPIDAQMASSSPGDDPPPNMIATFVLTPLQYIEPLPDSAQPYKVACVDGSSSKIDLVFFRKSVEGWRKIMESMPLGSPKIVSGRVQPAFGNQDLSQPNHGGNSERNNGDSGGSVLRAQLQVSSCRQFSRHLKAFCNFHPRFYYIHSKISPTSKCDF